MHFDANGDADLDNPPSAAYLERICERVDKSIRLFADSQGGFQKPTWYTDRVGLWYV